MAATARPAATARVNRAAGIPLWSRILPLCALFWRFRLPEWAAVLGSYGR